MIPLACTPSSLPRRGAALSQPVRCEWLSIANMIEWRRFCGGLLLGAFEEGVARAAISGPHPNGRYALSFYGKDERRELFLVHEQKAKRVAERVLAAWSRGRSGGRD